MTNFLLFLVVMCCVAWLVFNFAYLADELSWAATVCSALPMFCSNPRPLAFAAGGFAVLWLLIKFVSAILN